jgi:DNA-binding beta-propeller fold protein YncE
LKIVKSFEDREQSNGIYFKGGEFHYQLEHCWAKWPKDVKGSDVLGAVFDANDNLYVTTSCLDHPVCIFDAKGDFVKSIGKGILIRPHSVAWSKRNTLLLPDSSSTMHAVREIDLDGNLLRNFGNPFQASDTGYDENAFINSKIRGDLPAETPYDAMLEFYLRTDSIVRTAPPFNIPCGVGVTSKGEMFVADGYGNAAVHKFDAQGNYVSTFGKPGKEIGEFRLPHWLWVDKYDRIWVADRENSRAYAFSEDFEILCVAEGGFWRTACVWSDDENVYLGELRGGLSIMDIDSLEMKVQLGYPVFNIFNCHGLCGDSKGNLIITSILGSRPIGNLYRLKRLR